MSHNSRIWIFLAVLFIAAAGAANAQERSEKGFYFTVGGGINWLDMGVWGTQIPADTGFALNGTVGYDFNKWIGTELNSGYIYNSGALYDSSLHQAPIIFNVLLHLPPHSRFDPYAGFGLGVVVEHISRVVEEAEEDAVDESSSGGDAAVQFIAGMNYYLKEKIAVGAHYRYIWLASLSLFTGESNGNDGLIFDFKYRF